MFARLFPVITAYTIAIKFREALLQIINLFDQSFLNIKNIGFVKLKEPGNLILS